MLECGASARAIVATLCSCSGAGLGRNGACEVAEVDVAFVGQFVSPPDVYCGAVFSDIPEQMGTDS